MAVGTPATPVVSATLIDSSYGVSTEAVIATSAVDWARASAGPAQLHVEYDTDPGFTRPRLVVSAPGAAVDTPTLPPRSP